MGVLCNNMPKSARSLSVLSVCISVCLVYNHKHLIGLDIGVITELRRKSALHHQKQRPILEFCTWIV